MLHVTAWNALRDSVQWFIGNSAHFDNDNPIIKSPQNYNRQCAVHQYMIARSSLVNDLIALMDTGILCAPLGAIVPVTETTGNVMMFLPMIVACFAAMLAPTTIRRYAGLGFARSAAICPQETNGTGW